MAAPIQAFDQLAAYRSVSFDTSTDNVDLFALLGSPAIAVDVYVLVRDSVTIGAALNPGASEPDPAFLIEGFADGSRVYIENRGRIAGGGGIGGGGDRSRRDNQTPSSFVGGGGGGGAGSSSDGGAHAVESDPDATAMTDGDPGTDTDGGAGGDNDFNGGIGNSPYVAGTDPQFGGAAIRCVGADLYIDNGAGEIWAGADGGRGGRQTGSLPGGAQDPEDGDDLAGDMTNATVEGDEAEAVYISGGTLTWVDGDTYPLVIGYVREIA